MISRFSEHLRRIIIIACILISGCSEPRFDHNKVALGLCFDHRILMVFPDVEGRSLYLVVGDFLARPSEFDFNNKSLSIKGISKENKPEEMIVDRQRGMVKIVGHRSQYTLERKLAEGEFWVINQLVDENVNYTNPLSLQDNLILAFSKVLGKEFANEFALLVEAEIAE